METPSLPHGSMWPASLPCMSPCTRLEQVSMPITAMDVRSLVLRAAMPCLNGWSSVLLPSLQGLGGTCIASDPCSRQPGTVPMPGTPCQSRHLHTSAPTCLATSGTPHMASPQPSSDQEDAYQEPKSPPRAHLFVSSRPRLHTPPVKKPTSMQPHREIFFPNLTLQMMRLRDDQMQQIRDTGWTREVAFRTTPNVTKLEIKAYLESLYGMKVERVSTINYMGRKFTVPAKKVGQRRMAVTVREDDWKKAYVIFTPPEGLPQPPQPPPDSPLDMLRQLREIRRARGGTGGRGADSAEEAAGVGASLTPRSQRRQTYICTQTGTLINPHPVLTAAGLESAALPAAAAAGSGGAAGAVEQGGKKDDGQALGMPAEK